MNIRVWVSILLVQSSGAVPDCAKGVGTPCLPQAPQNLSAKYLHGPDSREYVRRYSAPWSDAAHSCTYTEPFGCAEMALSDEGHPRSERVRCGQCHANNPRPGAWDESGGIVHFCSDDGAWVAVFKYVDEDCTTLTRDDGIESHAVTNSCETRVIQTDDWWEIQNDGCSAEAPPCKAVNSDATECSGWTDEKCLDHFEDTGYCLEMVSRGTGRGHSSFACCKGGPEKVHWNIESSEITEASSGLFANMATCRCLTNNNGELKVSECTDDLTNLGTQSFVYHGGAIPFLMMGTYDDGLCVVADGAPGDKAYFKDCTEADSSQKIGKSQSDRNFAHPSRLRLSIDDDDHLVLAEADDFDERQFFEFHTVPYVPSIQYGVHPPHWSCQPTPSTPTHIQSLGLCADLPGGDTSDGKVLWMWECYDGENQEWVFNAGKITWGHSRKCLTWGNSLSGFQGLVGLTQCGGPSQTWRFNATTSAIMYGDESYTAMWCIQAGISQRDGITVEECNGEENQVWSLGALSDVQRSLVV